MEDRKAKDLSSLMWQRRRVRVDAWGSDTDLPAHLRRLLRAVMTGAPRAEIADILAVEEGDVRGLEEEFRACTGQTVYTVAMARLADAGQTRDD